MTEPYCTCESPKPGRFRCENCWRPTRESLPEQREQQVQESEGYVIERVRASLQARLEGRNEGGDIEIMRLVDEIVKASREESSRFEGELLYRPQGLRKCRHGNYGRCCHCELVGMLRRGKQSS
jgi:hypothetical protein